MKSVLSKDEKSHPRREASERKRRKKKKGFYYLLFITEYVNCE
jgi:hypothetical protein